MENYIQILKKYWGYSSFRPVQDQIIHSIGQRKDTLGLMPTGGGKSITFQVPAMATEGICLVITPLISLMQDQMDRLKQLNIKALVIHSGMSKDEIEISLDNAVHGDYKFLYLSPERLSSYIFRAKAPDLNVNIITVDEAHCISQWGYDFRPSYLKISELRKILPEVPVLALTATATADVVRDIQQQLNFREENVIKGSFNRKNLHYYVRYSDDKMSDLIKLINSLKGTGIVYVRNRKKTKEISVFLNKNNISADFYHAGISHEERAYKQEQWTGDEIRVMVATNAFGMGIDKPDVRFVVHYDLPDSIESYYQEAGRAGRDEKKSYAVLLVNNSDKRSASQRFIIAFPEPKEIKKIYQALGNYLKIPYGGGKGIAYDFNLQDFAASYKLNSLVAYSSLKIIEREGYLELTDELNNPSRVHFILNRQDLYKFQVENAKYDAFIKLILRSYTGIFNDYVPVDEAMLAKRAGVDQQIVYQYLLKLSTLKVVNYIPKKKTPLIIFHEERLEDKNLYISKESYGFRKNAYEIRLNTVLSYAFQDSKCRNQVLLEYFDEKSSDECGECDVCKNKKKKRIKEEEIDFLIKEIESVLGLKAEYPAELINKIPFPEEQVKKCIDWMIKEERIRYAHDGKLQLNV